MIARLCELHVVCTSLSVFEKSRSFSYCDNAGVLEEARFYGISKAVEPLEAMVQSEELALTGHFTRKEFLRMLSITSSSATLRCQVRDSLTGVSL